MRARTGESLHLAAMRFIICIHDVTPAYEREIRRMIRDLAPIAGRRLTLGIVPDWHGLWPLGRHVEYCSFVSESADELLLHGCHHQRRVGAGPVTYLTGGSDEMNGLDGDATRHTVERAQSIFADAFGQHARGFIAPAWQRGRVRPGSGSALEFVMGFLSIETAGRGRVPLATHTWDCGRWRRLGHVGHGIGRLLRSRYGRVPVLALHPRDLGSGFWPTILGLTVQLMEAGYEPATVSELLEARAEVGA